jgi:Mg/Co/Ni transporter MgtE
VVDDDGRFLGTVRASEVLAVIEERAARIRAEDARELAARVEGAAGAVR